MKGTSGIKVMQYHDNARVSITTRRASIDSQSRLAATIPDAGERDPLSIQARSHLKKHFGYSRA